MPKEAIEALAGELAKFAAEDKPAEVYRYPAETMLRIVEKAWPHSPPGHDYASTTASHEQIATQAAGYKYFGFGRGPSVVKA